MSDRTVFALLFLLVAPAPAAWSHGLERHYGTPINGQGAPAAAQRGGSPGFSLLLLDTTSKAMERALDEGRPDEVRARAEKLPRTVEELGHRSQSIEPALPDPAHAVVRDLSRCATRVYALARTDDDTALRAELGELRKLIASMQGFLRESDQP